MTRTDNPDEHPAYCVICDRPNYNGFEICDACERRLDDDENWGGMNRTERVDFVTMNIRNGNLLDAMDFLMHEGDVRVDSVRLAIDVVAQLCIEDVRSVDDVVDQLNRIINVWETS